jgi:hypothetical protein
MDIVSLAWAALMVVLLQPLDLTDFSLQQLDLPFLFFNWGLANEYLL